MSDIKKNTSENTTEEISQGVAVTVASDIYGEKKGGRQGGGFRGPRRGGRDEKPKDEMEQRILEVARVTRVMAGGKRMNFRACVAIGDKKGSVGVGLGKGADVTMAVNKAVNRAKKTLVKVSMVNETIPHEVALKMGAARQLIKPAKKGRGVIAGGVSRIIFELAGIKNITSKALGSKNKVNNARCAIEALRRLHKTEKKEVKTDPQSSDEKNNKKKMTDKQSSSTNKK